MHNPLVAATVVQRPCRECDGAVGTRLSRRSAISAVLTYRPKGVGEGRTGTLVDLFDTSACHIRTSRASLVGPRIAAQIRAVSLSGFANVKRTVCAFRRPRGVKPLMRKNAGLRSKPLRLSPSPRPCVTHFRWPSGLKPGFWPQDQLDLGPYSDVGLRTSTLFVIRFA
jgi:hypothetical protein